MDSTECEEERHALFVFGRAMVWCLLFVFEISACKGRKRKIILLSMRAAWRAAFAPHLLSCLS
jgi:hypothetical protein